MRKRKIFGIIICVLTIAVACIGIYILEKNKMEDEVMKDFYGDVKGRTIKIMEYPNNASSEQTERYIDWSQYKGTDVIGWLFFGEIEYPIVQGTNNSYYLDHMYDGSYNYNGSIFLSCHCKSDFSGTNSIVYGHNMITGAMFGNFDDNINTEEYKGEKEFYIYLPDGTKHTYELFSINHVFDTGIAYHYEFATKKDYEEYQTSMLSSSVYKFREDIDLDRRVCTLSTCNGWGSSEGRRIVYVGIESKVEQTQEGMDWVYKVE